MRRIRAVDRVSVYIIHLGVNDLKIMNPAKVLEFLTNSIKHLLATSNAKVLFSKILPVEESRLNDKIKYFNTRAEEFITNLRKSSGYENRLFTIFNSGFTKYEVSDMRNLYSDSIHLNENGTAKLCFYLQEALRRSDVLPTSSVNSNRPQPIYPSRFRYG